MRDKGSEKKDGDAAGSRGGNEEKSIERSSLK